MVNLLTIRLQVIFAVKGLAAPEEGVRIGDNILIKGVPNATTSHVFMKGTVQTEDQIDGFQYECLEALTGVLLTYGVVRNVYATILHWIVEEISSDELFGDPESIKKLKTRHYYTKEQRMNNIPVLKLTAKTYDSIRDALKRKEKAFLRNALYYHYRSLGDPFVEQQLIDLFIALESLFSMELQELRLRLSLRASSLLSIGQDGERQKIYKTIYGLYQKRSKIVHGEKTISLNPAEIALLRDYVKKSIMRLVHINMSKRKILALLDDAILDSTAKERLEKMLEPLPLNH